MYTFSDLDRQKIQGWLSGGKSYVTEIVIKYRTGVMSDIPGWESGSFNRSRDWNSWTQNYSLIPEYELEVSEVRYKAQILKPDMTYRIPTLQFLWKDFAAVEQSVSRRVLRFALVARIRNVEDSSDVVILARTGFFKIKSVDYIRETSKESGADANIEAIPWFCEYNEEVPWGWKDLQDSGASDDSNPIFWQSMEGVFRMSQLLHDRKRQKIQQGSGVTYEDEAPCPYGGPFIIYNTPYYRPAGNGNPYYGAGVWSSFHKYNTLSCQKTALSHLTAYLCGINSVGGMIVPELCGFSDGFGVDAPLVIYSCMGMTFSSPDLDRLKSLYLGDLSYFETQESIGSVEEVEKGYIYSSDLPNLVDYNQEILTAGEYSYVFPISPLASEGVYIEFGSLDSKPDSVAGYSWKDIKVRSWSPFFKGVSWNKDLSVYYVSAGESVVSSVTLNVTWYAQALLEEQEFLPQDYYTSDKYDRFDKVKIDLSGLRASELGNGYQQNTGATTSTGSMFNLLYTYPRVQGNSVSFSAEWRPWINAGDIIKIKYQNIFLEDVVHYAIVLSIDANADTLSANYETLILSNYDSFIDEEIV